LVLKKVDKHKAWAIGVFIQGICYPPLVFLTPDNPHAYIILLSVVCTAGAAYAVIDIVMKSLLSDVIDHDTLQSGENHSASIFAISALMRKLNIAFGGGFAFMMLSWFGYEPSETTHSPTSVLYGLKFTYLIFPAFLSTAGALMLWRFPIDRKRHEIILQQLAERAK
ncbi:MAG: MFS transporter, partial [Hyphomonadaceae bacterium]